MAPRKRHIPRPVVPWREEHLTVCGRELDGLEQVTREEVAAVLAGSGCPAARPWLPELVTAWAAVLAGVRVCQVCADKADQFRPWDMDPAGVIRIEAGRADNWFYANTPEIPSLLMLELRAITDLIAAHRGEFDDLLERRKVLAALTAPPSA